MAYGGGGFDLGASQFGGGGFTVPSPAPDGGAYGGGKQQRNQNQTVRAVSIKHLLTENKNVEDDQFKVDGQDAAIITIVGRVVRIREEGSRVAMVLHDGTGRMEAAMFLNSDAEGDMQAKLMDWRAGTWVRCHGNLKLFDGKLSFNAYNVRTITDHNEVTYHFVQCVFQHLYVTKGPAIAAGGGGAGPYGVGHVGAYGGTQQHAGRPGAGPGPQQQQGAGQGQQGLEEAVLAVYTSPANFQRQDGISLDEVFAALRGAGRGWTDHQIFKCVEYLTNEGHLYNTKDERHHRSTGSGPVAGGNMGAPLF